MRMMLGRPAGSATAGVMQARGNLRYRHWYRDIGSIGSIPGNGQSIGHKFMFKRTVLISAYIAVLIFAAGCTWAATQERARAQQRPDFNGIWDRVVKKPRPAQFDPNVLNATDQTPPLKAVYMKVWKDRLVAATKGDLSFDTSVTKCFPKGMPRVMMAPFGLEIVQSERQISMFNEASQETGRIVLDGRRPPDDYDPSYIGFSTGRWDGTALRTITTGLREDTMFDGSGIPHSDSLTVEQTFRLLDENTLENIVTSKDPKALEHDWVVRMVYRRAPKDSYVDEAVCLENNMNASRTGPTK